MTRLETLKEEVDSLTFQLDKKKEELHKFLETAQAVLNTCSCVGLEIEGSTEREIVKEMEDYISFGFDDYEDFEEQESMEKLAYDIKEYAAHIAMIKSM